MKFPYSKRYNPPAPVIQIWLALPEEGFKTRRKRTWLLETAWVKVAEGERAEAKRIIDATPASHPFELRYTQVAALDWESCRSVLDAEERQPMLQKGW